MVCLVIVLRPRADIPGAHRMHEELDRETVARTLHEVEAIAAAVNIPLTIERDGEMLQGHFKLPGGRHQRVYVRVSGRTTTGLRVLTLFSVFHHVKDGEGLSASELRALLLVNEHQRFVRVAIWPMDGDELLVVSWDQILETMEAEELATQVRSLVLAADELEKLLSDDDRF